MNEQTIQARIQADTSDIRRQLDELSKTPVSVPVKIDADSLNLDKQIQGFQKKFAETLVLTMNLNNVKKLYEEKNAGGATKSQPSPIPTEYTRPDAAETHRKAKPYMAA